MVQKQSFPRGPILLYSAGLLDNSKEEPPPSTGLLGRPLALSTPELIARREAAARLLLTFDTLGAPLCLSVSFVSFQVFFMLQLSVS